MKEGTCKHCGKLIQFAGGRWAHPDGARFFIYCEPNAPILTTYAEPVEDQ